MAFAKTPYITVYGDDYHTKDGTGVRDYIHVADLAYGHVKALDYLISHTSVEAVNLGTGTGYSVFELIRAFEENNSIRIPYKVCPRRAGDIDACYADPSKAKALFGWQAAYGLDDMCKDAYQARKKLEEAQL